MTRSSPNRDPAGVLRAALAPPASSVMTAMTEAREATTTRVRKPERPGPTARRKTLTAHPSILWPTNPLPPLRPRRCREQRRTAGSPRANIGLRDKGVNRRDEPYVARGQQVELVLTHACLRYT